MERKSICRLASCSKELLGVTAAEARSQTRAGCVLAEAACALLLDNSRA